MQINFCNLRSEGEHGSRKAMQRKLSTEHDCKDMTSFKYQSCAPLHVIRLQWKCDWFIWHLGKRDVVATERLNCTSVFTQGKKKNKTSFSQCDGFCHIDMPGFFHSWTGTRAHHPYSVKIYRVVCQQVAGEREKNFLHLQLHNPWCAKISLSGW